MDLSIITDNLPILSKGLATTAQLTLITIVGGLVIGTPLAIARSSKVSAFRYPTMLIIEAVRGTPILMLIFWFYFMLPRLIGAPIPAFIAGAAALIFFNAAYSAEIIRAGIQAVDRGHVEAARSSGLSELQIARLVVLPQAFQMMTPALLSQAVMVYKTTSLIYIIGVMDFFKSATIINNRDFRPIEIFALVAIVYFVPSFLVSRFSRRLEGVRLAKRGLIHSTT